MSNENYKIQLVFEAANKAQASFTELTNAFKNLRGQLQEMDDVTKKTGAGLTGLFDQMKQHWIGVSAAIAGVAVTLSKAFDYMELGAKAQQAEASFRKVAAASGESADKIIADMKRASAGTVDDSDIMQKAVKGLIQGLSGNQLVKIMEMARVAARVSGESVSQAYETITDAIANKLPASLMRYGLVNREQIRLVREALTLGITEIDVYSLAMENLGKQTKKFGEMTEDTSEKLQAWQARIHDIKETAGGWLDDLIIKLNTANSLLGTISGGIGVRLLTEALKGKQIETLSSHGPGFDYTQPPSSDSSSGTSSDGATKSLKALIAAAKLKPEMLGPDRSNLKAWEESQAALAKEAAAWKAAQEAAINYKLYLVDLAEQERSMSKAEATEKRIDLNKEMLGIQEEYLTKVDRLKDPTAWYTQQQAIIKTRQELLLLNKQMQEQSGTLFEGFKEGFAQYIYDAKTAFQQGVKLAQDAAQAMEQAFSDFFFDAFTGKLKHFSDYLKSFFDAVARAMANAMAQKTTVSLLSGIGNWGGSGSSTMTNSTTGSEGLAAVGHQGGYIMHAGGLVPRFHIGGLASDERPIIAQTGEGILSRKGMAAFDRMNQGGDIAGGKVPNIIVNVENKGQPMEVKAGNVRYDRQAEAFVVGVFMKNLEYNGPIRQGIMGMGRY